MQDKWVLLDTTRFQLFQVLHMKDITSRYIGVTFDDLDALDEEGCYHII